MSAIPFAEDIVLDMGMGDVVIAPRLARIERDDRVRLVAAKLVERESDFERAEINAFQDNPFGSNSENFGRPVDVDLIELVLNGLQFFQQQSECRNLRLRFVTFQVFCLMETVLGESSQRLRQLSSNMCLSGGEARSIGELQSVLQLLDPVPVFLRQRGLIRRATVQPLILQLKIFCRPQPGAAAQGKVHSKGSRKEQSPSPVDEGLCVDIIGVRSAAAESSRFAGSRIRTDVPAVNQDRSEHDRHAGKHSPGIRCHSADGGDDQDSREVETVEPLTGSHGNSFGVEVRGWRSGIRVKEE